MSPKPLIYALDDHNGWGRELFMETVRRGWDGNLFSQPDQVQGETLVFMGLDNCTKILDRQKAMMRQLLAAGHRVIPEWEACRLHNDKVAQADFYKAWMPATWSFQTEPEAQAALSKCPWPLVSKTRTGADSVNRLLHNPEEARQEISQVFGKGLPIHHYHGERLQQGYLLWQEFMSGNTYDYRVVATGRMRMILRRHHQVGGPVRIEPVEVLDEETRSVLVFANDFFFDRKLHWCAIDVVQDRKRSQWRLLETTVYWKKRDHGNCRYFDADGAAQPYTGSDILRLFCDEIEEGAFNQ